MSFDIAYLDRFSFRSRYVGSFVALLPDDHVKLYNFSITNTANSLSWIIA